MGTPRIIALCGAPGSGKSTLLPYLVPRLAPRVVVDLDELKDPDGTLLGVPVAGIAPEYDRLWLRILTMITRAGHSVILLCQVPTAVGMTDPTNPVTDWLLLDCPDELRRVRLTERGSSREHIEDVLATAELARTMITKVVQPLQEESAEQIAERVVLMINSIDATP